MSRSYRNTPIISILGSKHSEKEDKKIWHRRFRHRNKILVNQGKEPLDYRELSDPWDMKKDGTKGWFGHYKHGRSKTYWCNRQYSEEQIKEWYKEYMRK